MIKSPLHLLHLLLLQFLLIKTVLKFCFEHLPVSQERNNCRFVSLSLSFHRNNWE